MTDAALGPAILRGTPASRGVADGRAVWAGAYIEDQMARDGFVLLCAELDRKVCAHLDSRVRAVVAQAGGVGSHGASILRELGIPCVVGVGEALREVQSCTLLRVDGSAGTVVPTVDPMDVPVPAQGGTQRASCDVSGDADPPPLGENASGFAPCPGGSSIPLVEEACYRPGRRYQKLRFDLLRPGWEASPEYLFALPRCSLERDGDGVVHVLRGPDIEALRALICSNVDWFWSAARCRANVVSGILRELQSVDPDMRSIPPDGLLRVLDALAGSYMALLRFVYLTQFLVDGLIEEWIEICHMVDARGALFVQDHLRSQYVREAASGGLYPGESTVWHLPSPQPHVWQGRILPARMLPEDDRFLRLALQTSLRDGCSLLERYSRYRLIVPLMYQMAEEHYFVSSSVCSFLNRAFDRASEMLFGSDVGAETRSQIFSFDLHEVRQRLSLLTACGRTT